MRVRMVAALVGLALLGGCSGGHKQSAQSTATSAGKTTPASHTTTVVAEHKTALMAAVNNPCSTRTCASENDTFRAWDDVASQFGVLRSQLTASQPVDSTIRPLTTRTVGLLTKGIDDLKAVRACLVENKSIASGKCKGQVDAWIKDIKSVRPILDDWSRSN